MFAIDPYSLNKEVVQSNMTNGFTYCPVCDTGLLGSFLPYSPVLCVDCQVVLCSSCSHDQSTHGGHVQVNLRHKMQLLAHLLNIDE